LRLILDFVPNHMAPDHPWASEHPDYFVGGTEEQLSAQGLYLDMPAWALMAVIGIGCCWLIAYRARRTDWLAFLVVPIAVSVCFFLIADLDSPRGGAIRVNPQNLPSLSQSLPAQ
jgi:hypothetical protein